MFCDQRIKKVGKYTHIKSVFDYKETIDVSILRDYNSTINPLTKQQLKDYLIKLELL